MSGLEMGLAIALGIITIVGAILAMVNKRRQDLDSLERQHTEELRLLAETRKEVIADLRAEMAEQDERHKEQIAELNTQIAELRGQYQAMHNFQVQAVVEGVVKGVLVGLGALDQNPLL